MKAAILNTNNGIFDVEDIDIDTPRGREVLVEVKASGLCHTDLHMAKGERGIPLPAVFGHEMAGIVREIGPDVREFAVGDHVVGAPVPYCGRCRTCLAGRTYQCEHPEETRRGAGEKPRLSRRGEPVTSMFGMSAFAEYALVHENQLVRVPEALPFPQAAVLGCGCVTGAGAAINTAGVKAGDTIAVIGIGGIGLNVISGARLAGARQIIAIDLHEAKEALARKFGATHFIAAGSCDVVEAVQALTEGGVDHVFEAVGLPSTADQSIRMARKGGAVYLIGINEPGSTIAVDVARDLIARQVTLRGVLLGSSNIKHDIPIYADLYLQGRFNLDDLISKEISIDEINESYRELESGAICRSVITSY